MTDGGVVEGGGINPQGIASPSTKEQTSIPSEQTEPASVSEKPDSTPSQPNQSARPQEISESKKELSPMKKELAKIFLELAFDKSLAETGQILMIDVNTALRQGLINQDQAEKLAKMIQEKTGSGNQSEVSQGNSVEKVITTLKSSEDPELKALGYDIEIKNLEAKKLELDQRLQGNISEPERDNLRKEISSIESEIKSLQQKRGELSSDLSRLSEYAKRMALAVKKLRIAYDPEKAKTDQTQPLTGEQLSQLELEPNEIQAIEKDPVGFLVEAFHAAVYEVIDVQGGSQKADKVTFSLNQEKLEKLLGFIKQESLFDEETLEEIKSKINEAHISFQDLSDEEKRKINMFRAEDLGKKGLEYIAMGGAIIALLMYFAAKKNQSSGPGGMSMG